MPRPTIHPPRGGFLKPVVSDVHEGLKAGTESATAVTDFITDDLGEFLARLNAQLMC